MKYGLGLVLCLAATAASAQVWVDGGGRSCDAACSAAGMASIASGASARGQLFYMCAGDVQGEGYRGGFNLRPQWADSCVVGAGGREVRTSSYSCLCAAGADQARDPVVRGPQFTPAPPPAPVVIVPAPAEPQGGRRIRIEEATIGLNCGMPRGNATAHVTRWCDRARDVCDYTIDPGVFGAPDSCQEDFSVRYHCGDDGRPKVSQSTVTGVMGQIVLTCP